MLEDFMPMDVLRILVFIIFFIRIIRTDLKKKEIHNKDLLLMGVVGFVLFLLGSQFDLMPSLATNVFLALIVGIGLWKMGIWSAGDGKLFAVCALYLPYKMYLPFFSSQIILMNVFILAFLYWLTPILFKTNRSEKLNAFKASFASKIVINLFLVLFGIFYFIAKFVYLIDIGLHASGYIISLAVALLAFGAVKKLFPSNAIYVFLAFAAARVLVDTSFMTFIGASIIVLTLLVLLFAGFLGNLSMHISYKEKKLSELEEGDVPIGVGVEKEKIEDFKASLKKKFKNFDVILRNGFSKEDLTVARKIKGIKGFVIKKTIPFAPLLFVSTLFVMFFNVDALLYILSLVYGWLYE